jgi:tetratricopeptide (TPR) repeat protein
MTGEGIAKMNLLPANLRSLGTAALIFAVTLLAYLPAVRGGFLWDDDFHVTQPDMQSAAGLKRIWCEVGATQQYYPLLHTAFWVEHRLWGDSVVGYHLTNILLHAAAACLVGLTVRRLFDGERAQQDRAPTEVGQNAVGRGAGLLRPSPRQRCGGTALLAALLFALHPVCVESVAWISEQKNTLSTVLCLGAALVYLRFDRDRRPSRYFWALGLFVLALLTKTVSATLPAALLVVFWWQRGRLGWRRDVWPLLPWFGLGAVAGLLTSWVERTFIGAQGADFSLTLLERCLLAGRAICFYLGKLAWPVDLVFIYPRWVIDASAWWQYLYPLGVLALVAGLGILARRQRGLLAGFLVFAGTLFPAVGFIDVYPFIYSYVADHFQYLASLGIIVPVAAGLTLVAGRLPSTVRWLQPVGGGVLLATLGALTWLQCGMYRDAGTLYRETLARNPACWMAHTNLGDLLSKIPGRLPEAIGHFQAALRINPRDVNAHNDLGHAFTKIPGRQDAAIAEYEAALSIDPRFAPAQNNLGIFLEEIPGRLPEAISHLETAVRLAPGAAELRDNLGTALLKIPERAAEATAQFEAAVRLNPGSADLQNNLGTALAKIPGRLPEAITHLEAAVRLNPRSTEMHSNLGVALAQISGRLPEAIAQFEAAVRAAPGSAEAHNNLGAALSRIPERAQEAIAQFEAAVRLKPDFVEAHNNLGDALAQIPGRQSEAIAEYEATLRLNPDSAEVHAQLGKALLGFPERLPEAIAQFETAIRLNPDLLDAHYALGILLSDLPDRRPEALAHFEEAARIRPDFAPAREWIDRLRGVRR